MQEPKHEVEWNSAKVPYGVSWLYYICGKCGNKVATSPRLGTDVMPSMYCSHCENGPPLTKYAVEFHDEHVERKGSYPDEELVEWDRDADK